MLLKEVRKVFAGRNSAIFEDNAGRRYEVSIESTSEKPLFTWDEVLRAMEDLDLTERGSDEEYNEVIFEEYMSLSKTRERVLNACKEIGEK